MQILSSLANNKKSWLILAISAFILEIVALIFQYALGLAPCIMCIYQRNAIWSIFLAGLLGYFTHTTMIGRLLSFTLWGLGAVWGLIIAMEHVNIQHDPFGFLTGCEIVPNFPKWAPLHEWIPALFAATGDCGNIDWQFLGYSMPQWMIAVFAIYAVLLAIVLGSRIINLKNI